MTEFSNDDAISVANMKRRIEHFWGELQHFLGTLTDEQLTVPTDAAGWTVKDHMVHLAVWEDGLKSLVDGGTQREGMNIDEATWEQDVDAINDVIYQRYRDLPLDEAKAKSQVSHETLVAKLYALTDEDLMRQTSADSTTPLIGKIAGNTFGHYAEQMPWMQAIVQNQSEQP
jgi:uncharacterized protein (TIGR03083 family)